MTQLLDNLKNELQPADGQSEPKPRFFSLSNESDQAELLDLLKNNPHTQVIDTYESQLLDYFVLQQPWLHLNHEQRDKEFVEYKKTHYGAKDSFQAGLWVHLPWRHVILHILEDEKYQEVRTGRNRNLILPDEQKKYYNSVIGIAGQSVGNSCTLSIVLTGGGKYLRVADPDTLELTNLNRIRGSIADITSPKVHMTARQVYELDPYAKLELFTDGLTEENIERFFDGPPKLDVVVDEMDNLGMKIRLRQEAKKRRIPVVMAADNGDSGVLDIERHDLQDDIPPFHGRAGEDLAERVLNKKLPLPVIGKIIGEEIIGYDIHEERMFDSLLGIGQSVPTWPQLGTAATLNGVLVAVAVRKILTNQPLINNRAVASIPSWLVPDYDSPKERKRHEEIKNKFVTEMDEKLSIFLGKGNSDTQG